MNLTRCNNGHFYDADKYASCPHCNSSVQPVDDGVTVALTGSQASMVTEAFDNDNSQTVALTDAIEIASSGASAAAHLPDEGKTISFYSDTMGTEPVVGWLVCLNGSHFGEGFPLKSGRNFIGRSASMDVILDSDPSVSRERHAIMIYEPKSRIFIAQPGDSRELFYMNDKVVLNNEQVQPYDRFTIGKTELLFVPLCGEKFSWDDLEKEDK
ncbi:MAG: FHA domain-containing protein [Enterocloster sp.]